MTRSEWGLLGVLVALGAGLRLAFPGQLAVEHFDEGVYSSNLWFSGPGEAGYPLRHLYAPPLLPWLIEWSLVFTGVARLGPLVPSLVAGCALPPSVWWIARRWFGREAGLAAAALAAVSDLHANLSRMALTDALLGLALAWSVYGAAAWLGRGGWRNLAIASGAGAVAWWTKYNGWLPLAIAASGCVGWWVTKRWIGATQFNGSSRRDGHANGSAARADSSGAPGRAARTDPARVGGRLVLLLGLTLVLWSPVWFDLQAVGGYGPVAANHGRYVTGLAGWPAALRTQIENLRLIECGATSLFGPCLALFAPAALLVFERREDGAKSLEKTVSKPFPWTWGIVAAVCWGAATLVAGPLAPLAVVSLAAVAREFVAGRTGAARHEISTWLWLAWFVGLTIATPLYHPYARLTLPWLVAAWIGAGWSVSGCWRERSRPREANPGGEEGPAERRAGAVTWGTWVGVVLVALVALALTGWRNIDPTPSAWDSRLACRQAASDILEATRRESASGEPVFLVYGEPALVYELRALGAPLVAPIGDLGAAQSIASRGAPSAWVILGPHSEHDAAVREWLAAQPDSARQSFPLRCSRFTLLDRHSAAEIANGTTETTERVTLVRLPRD